MKEKFTEKQLEEEARKFLKETFDMDLEIPVLISGRMKNTFGMFRHQKYRRESVDIRMSRNFLKYHTKEDILGTLKHECVHYALYEIGKPHRDGDFFFEQTLKLFNIPRTGTKKFKGQVHEYACSECGKTFTRQRRGVDKRYVTGCCGAEIKYNGPTIIGVADERE